MLEFDQQSTQSTRLQALSTIINTEVKKPAVRMRYQMVAFDMAASLNLVQKDMDRDMLSRFYERFLPITISDWMTKL